MDYSSVDIPCGGEDKQAATAVNPEEPPKPDIQMETREGVKKNNSSLPCEENANGEGIKNKIG